MALGEEDARRHPAESLDQDTNDMTPPSNSGSVVTVVPGRDVRERNAAREVERPSGRLDEEQLGPLVELARCGDQGAFEEIVRLMQGPVRSFARRMMRDAYLGDDAAQETFFRMWKGIARHQPRGRFISWSFTVARNTCIEFLRREGRTPRPVAEIRAETHDPMHDVDIGSVVNEAIAELDEPYRSTFLLRETGLAYDEVADALDCPVGTVRSRLHEARKRLAATLEPEFGGAA